MKLKISVVSDKGCIRENNEDMVLIGTKLLRDDRFQDAVELNKDTSKYIVAVADGMGGANAGEVASQMVLELLREGFYSLETGLNDGALKESIELLCREVHQQVL